MIILHDIQLSSDCILWANDTDWAAKEPRKDDRHRAHCGWPTMVRGPGPRRPKTCLDPIFMQSMRSLTVYVSKEVLLPSARLQRGKDSAKFGFDLTPACFRGILPLIVIRMKEALSPNLLLWLVLMESSAGYRHQPLKRSIPLCQSCHLIIICHVFWSGLCLMIIFIIE